MSVLPILQHPDPKLRLVSSPVTRFSHDVTKLIDDLFDTLYASGGVALSAPQVGEHYRVMVMDFSPDNSQGTILVNPSILFSAKTRLVQESCLSLPGISASVFRAIDIRVAAQDFSGKHFEQEYSKLPAVSVQHEIDHLNGNLFIDRLPWFERVRFKWGRTVLATE